MQVFRFADIVVDKGRMQVSRAGAGLELEPKAMRVLIHLIEHRERVVGKEELLASVWHGTFVTDNAVTRVVAQIRKHLGDSARSPKYIETVATSGYRFVAELMAEGETGDAEPLRGRRWSRFGLIPGLAAAAALLWGILMVPTNAPVAVSGIRQITNSAAADLWPAFSPDGKQLAFSSDRTGHFEIYVRSLPTGEDEQALTTDGQDNIQPAFSPDGKRIAYVSKARGGIRILDAGSKATRQLTDAGVDPHWSPDGRMLVYRSGSINAVRETGPWDCNLLVVDVERGESRPLTRVGQPRGGHNFPRWLPDGRHVVFTAPVERSAASTWVVDVRSGEVRPIPVGVGALQFPSFDAEGRYLYFVSAGREEAIGLWRARMDRSGRPRDPQSVMPTSGPVIRDVATDAAGSRVAYSQEFGQSEIWTVGVGRDGRALGEPKPLIQDHSFRNTVPSFSGDGTKVAYASVRQGGGWTVMVANADGSANTPVMFADHANATPAWIAHKLTLAFQVLRNGQGSYWLANGEGPPKRLQLKLDLRRAEHVRVSRDGKRVAAHVWTPSGAKIMIEDLTSGEVRELTSEDRNISFPCWSPDGRWIAAQERVAGRSTLVVIGVETGEIQTLVNEAGHSWAHDWSPDGDRIAFAGMRDGNWNLYWVSRASGHVEKLTDFRSQSAFVRYPSWSPRNDQVVFEHNELAANIYVATVR